jgi:hypothetical protein
MCLVLPQNDTDYFCSKACLEESMSKESDEDEDVDEEYNSADSKN